MTRGMVWGHGAVFSPQQREIIAFHEAGHAVAAAVSFQALRNEPFWVDRVAIARSGGGIATVHNGKNGYCDGICSGFAKEIAIEADRKFVAHSRLRHWRERIRWAIVHLLAGPYAQLLHMNSAETYASMFSADLQGGSKTDFESALKLYAMLDDEISKPIPYGAIHRQSRSLCLEHWPAISALAAELLLCDELFASDVERVLSPFIQKQNLSLAA